jgi:SRSO17 transposase
MKQPVNLSKTALRLALALGLLTSPLAARGEDAWVKRRLDLIGMKYTVDKDGDYKVTIDFAKERRTQMIFVSGKTESLGGMTIRKIFSPAGIVATDGIDGAKALELLRDSRVKKLGSWEIEGANLYLVVKLPDTLTTAQLQAVLMATASLADDMEITLSGKRDAL